MREAFVDARELFEELGSRSTGLTRAEAKGRFEAFGPNQIEEGRTAPVYLRFMPHLTNLFALLLWVAGVLAFIGGMPQLAYAVFAVIVINGAFSFLQEFKAERATRALKNLLPRITTVLRDGRAERSAAETLVPGDVILLESGDAIPADARVLESNSLLVNNSSLTGESEPVARNNLPQDAVDVPVLDLHNMIFMGTTVAGGNCKAIVLRTGPRTEFGKVARLTQQVREDLSPLQKQIGGVTRLVAILSVGMGLVFFALGVAIGRSFIENFLFAIGIIVANVPEGLLPTVTLALAMGMQRMARRNALVKKLSAVETLGSTNVILTDKTGTLTQNRMTTTRIFVAGSSTDTERVRASPARDSLIEGMVLANNARLAKDQDGQADFVGDPTEAALLVAALRMGADIERIPRKSPRVFEIPFDSRRKRMTSVHRKAGEVWALTKGAPGEVLVRCDTALTAGGQEPMTGERRQEILEANDAMARSGLRVLAFARRKLESQTVQEPEAIESQMCFVGLAGMFDPPRVEVAQAVARAHTAGIRVIMVTGDYGLTAQSIARRVGIVGGDDTRMITGQDLNNLGPDVLATMLQESAGVIFARVSPEDKMKIVQALQATGNIVAVTGDGVNDAPALKSADIGVAMGRSGTDVAKEAADMVLTDDNFASIVAAVEEGRTVYQNIRKFITYILASNVPEIVPYILYVLFGIPLPLTVMQILAVDLGTDLLPALALGLEAPEPGIMERPPRPREERLVDARLLGRAYGFLGLIEAGISMSAYFWFLHRSGWTYGQALDVNSLVYRQATTMVFAGIVTSQVANVFATRTDVSSVFRIGLFSNKWVLVGIVWELSITAMLLYVPFLQSVFGTAPLGLREWGFLWLLTPSLLVAEECRKWLVRRNARR